MGSGLLEEGGRKEPFTSFHAQTYIGNWTIWSSGTTFYCGTFSFRHLSLLFFLWLLILLTLRVSSPWALLSTFFSLQFIVMFLSEWQNSPQLLWGVNIMAVRLLSLLFQVDGNSAGDQNEVHGRRKSERGINLGVLKEESKTPKGAKRASSLAPRRVWSSILIMPQ